MLFYPIDPGHEDESWRRSTEEPSPGSSPDLRGPLHARADCPVREAAPGEAPLELGVALGATFHL